MTQLPIRPFDRVAAVMAAEYAFDRAVQARTDAGRAWWGARHEAIASMIAVHNGKPVKLEILKDANETS